MTDRLMRIVGLAALLGFLGILVWEVPRIDLGAVVAITLLLALWDAFKGERNTRD